MNRIEIIGRWVENPLVTYVGEDKLPCLKCRVASPDYKRKNSDGTYHHDFFNISVMGEKVEHLKNRCGCKGNEVIIWGKLRTSKYKNDDGENRLSYEIRAYSIKVLSKLKTRSEEIHDIDDIDEDYDYEPETHRNSSYTKQNKRSRVVDRNRSATKSSSSKNKNEQELDVPW